MFCRQIILMKVLFLFLTLSQIIDTLFVDLGNYPDYRQYGINLDNCGQSIKPESHIIDREQHCFAKSSGNFTVEIINNFTHHIMSSPGMSSRIFKGRTAYAGESPWTAFVLISFGKFEGFNTLYKIYKTNGCNGVLITFEWVLISALCLNHDSPEDFKLLVVEVWARYPDAKNYANIYKSRPNPIYKDPDEHLALIKLRKPYVPEFEYIWIYTVNTVCLPNINASNNKEEEWATFTGWGVTSNSMRKPERLKLAQIRLSPQKDCIPGLNQLCSIASQTQLESQPCLDDWGGPLVQFSNETIPKAILVGTLRTHDQGGSNSCPSNGSSYFIPTAHYVEWILSIVKTK